MCLTNEDDGGLGRRYWVGGEEPPKQHVDEVEEGADSPDALQGRRKKGSAGGAAGLAEARARAASDEPLDPATKLDVRMG